MKRHFALTAGWILALTWFASSAALHAQPFLQNLVTNNLLEPYAVAVNTNGVFYVTDSANNRVMSYNADSGSLTNYAGSPMSAPGTNDGPGVFSLFYNPQGIVYSATRGGLVVADAGNHTLRFIADSNGAVSTLAGVPGVPGANDGAGAAARFDSPAGLATDGAGNIFIADLLNNKVRKLDINNNVTTIGAAGKFNRPSGLSYDTATGNLYVADAGNNAIQVIHTTDGAVSLLAGSGSPSIFGDADSLIATKATFNSPRGVLWLGGTVGLVVSDTGNHMLRRVYFNSTFNTNSVERYGQFGPNLSAPMGMSEDQNGNIALADLGNNSLDLVQVTVPQPPVSPPVIGVVNLVTNSFGSLTTLLTAVTNAVFNNDVTPAISGEAGTQTFYTTNPNADPKNPAGWSPRSTPPPYQDGATVLPQPLFSPSVSGPVVTVMAYGTANGRKPSPVVSAQFTFQVANPTISSKNMGNFTLADATTGADLWYTTDGSTPVEGAPAIHYTPGAALNIVNGTNNVVFTVRAFRLGYNSSDPVQQTFLFSDLQTSSIGIPNDFNAGIGSTIIVPVEVKLASTDTLKSLQFRVEVAPNGSAPSISSQFRALNFSTNDFIPINLPGTNLFTVLSYTNGPAAGLAVAFVGHESGLNVSGSATVSLLAIPIPVTATLGQTYTVSLLQPSGTSDGLQTPVILKPLRARTITVTNISYVVGDSAVAQWYNAGDFGDGNLENADVNNAFHASLGLNVPYSFSDVFDAMDAYPEDSSIAVGGDGQIRFLDWNIILSRSLRLTTNNWTRSWSAGGVRVNNATTLPISSPDSPAQEISTQPAPVWNRQALIGAKAVENAAPGAGVGVPLYIKVRDGNAVAGLQFRVAIDANDGAPPVSGPAQFAGDGLLPNPMALQGGQDGLPPNQAVGAWSIVQNKISPALSGSHPLGAVSFVIPPSAKSGQSYTVHFVNADGSPDLHTQYDFETLPALVWVGTKAQKPPETVSDEWKIHFFGSLANPNAADDADPDGDGVPNSAEYANGTNPIKLRLHSSDMNWKSDLKSGQFSVRWYAQGGKNYVVEQSSDLKTWAAVGSPVSGNNDIANVSAAVQVNAPGFFRVRLSQ